MLDVSVDGNVLLLSAIIMPILTVLMLVQFNVLLTWMVLILPASSDAIVVNSVASLILCSGTAFSILIFCECYCSSYQVATTLLPRCYHVATTVKSIIRPLE